MWWAVGAILGVMLVGGAGGTFITAANRRRAMPMLVAAAIVTALVVGWALNAWIAFYQASANM